MEEEYTYSDFATPKSRKVPKPKVPDQVAPSKKYKVVDGMVKLRSTVNKVGTKEKRPWDDEIPTQEDEIRQHGEALIACMREEGVYHLVSYCNKIQKRLSWLDDLQKKYPEFGKYLDAAKQILGAKMMKLSVEKGIYNKVYSAYLPRYLKDRDVFVSDIRDYEAARVEAAKQALMKESDHPLWHALEEVVKMRKAERSAHYPDGSVGSEDWTKETKEHIE